MDLEFALKHPEKEVLFKSEEPADDVSLQDITEAMREHLPETLEQLRAADKARTAERLDNVVGRIAAEQAEMKEEVTQMEDAFNRDVWEEQLQAAAKVTDDASYEEYHQRRDQLQALDKWRRQRDREEL